MRYSVHLVDVDDKMPVACGRRNATASFFYVVDLPSRPGHDVACREEIYWSTIVAVGWLLAPLSIGVWSRDALFLWKLNKINIGPFIDVLDSTESRSHLLYKQLLTNAGDFHLQSLQPPYINNTTTVIVCIDHLVHRSREPLSSRALFILRKQHSSLQHSLPIAATRETRAPALQHISTWTSRWIKTRRTLHQTGQPWPNRISSIRPRRRQILRVLQRGMQSTLGQ